MDFSRQEHSPHALMSVQGTDIERVSTYKHMDVHLNNKLNWSHHADALYRKAQSRLFLMMRLRCVGVEGTLFRTFFVCALPSVIFDGVISAQDRERLVILVRGLTLSWAAPWTLFWSMLAKQRAILPPPPSLGQSDSVGQPLEPETVTPTLQEGQVPPPVPVYRCQTIQITCSCRGSPVRRGGVGL